MSPTHLGSMDDGGPVAVLMGWRRRRGRRSRPRGLGMMTWTPSYYDRPRRRRPAGPPRMTNSGCLNAFLRGLDCRSDHLRHEGGVLSSYGRTIAWWVGAEVHVDCGRMPSITTAKHRNMVLRYAGRIGQAVACENLPPPKPPKAPRRERLVQKRSQFE